MDNESLRLGISLTQNKIRFVEAEIWNNETSLLNVTEADLDTSFEMPVIRNNDLVPRFATVIDNAVNSSSLQARTARLSLGRRFALTKAVLLDKELEESKVRQHIEWELDQYLISPRDEFNVGFEYVSPPGITQDIAIVVAVRKSVVRYIQEIFKKTVVSLDTIDLDIFSEMRALKKGADEIQHGLNAIVNISDNGLNLVLLENGHFLISSEYLEDENDQLEGTSSQIAQTIHRELNSLAKKMGRQNAQISNIYFSGESVESSVLYEVGNIYNETTVRKANPFDNVHRQLNLEAEDFIQNIPEKFVASFGMVID